MATAASLVPAMRYRDLAGAVGWLCETYGFAKQHVVTDQSGRVLFAQLKFGGSNIMLGPVGDSDIDGFLKQPDEIGGVETQSCYLVVDDIDEHRARSEAAGAQIIIDIRDFAYGGRGYSCRDPEGHIWNFGTYDPNANAIDSTSKTVNLRLLLTAATVAIVSVAVMATLAIERKFFGTTEIAAASANREDGQAALPPRMAQVNDAPVVAPNLAPTKPLSGPTEVTSRHLAESLADRLDKRSRTAAARAVTRRARARLVRIQQQMERAEQARRQAEENLQRERNAKLHSDEFARGVSQQLSIERAAKEKAERALLDLQEKLHQSEVAPLPIAKGARQAKASAQPSQKRSPRSAGAKAPVEAADSMPALIP